MAVGKVSTRALTGIANAIRKQNGSAALYKPSQMAAAVAALDGSQEGEPKVEAYKELATGVVSSKVFDAIGSAIRGQNGETAKYLPGEMAAAILALEWDSGPRLRAVWRGDGVLEFNYLDGVRSVSGMEVIEAFEVDMAGYPSMSARPWEHLKGEVSEVLVDSSVADAGVKDVSYWFAAFSRLRVVRGFENVDGVTDFAQVFTGCAELRSVYATHFDPSTVARSWQPFYGCTRLVGGADCAACSGTGGAPNARVTAGGFFTDPANDNRTWLHGALFSDGALEVDASPVDAAGREVLAEGDLCANASYAAIQCAPWSRLPKEVRRVRVLPGAAELPCVNLSYWFYGCSALESVEGFSNLRGTAYMRHAFNSCTGLVELDLRGLAPGGLRSLAYAFAGCPSLERILVDAGWELPALAAGIGTFYGDVRLVGGNGTAYDASSYGAQRCVVDREGRPGYLTGV